MPKLIDKPAVVQAVGTKAKVIDEFVGRVSTGTEVVSIARMHSPSGWAEPGQTPEFDEYSVVLTGMLRVESEGETIDVRAGQAVIARAGEYVRYSTPDGEGADYIAVCVPAFSPETVNRDG
jgi:mannose-6-phosphate isomerase-like protein (cupin superfamily)